MSKKKVTKKKAVKKAAEKDQAQVFFAAVHPYLSAAFSEPMASQHTRAAYRRFQELTNE